MSVTLAQNTAMIKRDIGLAKELLDTYAIAYGASYERLIHLSFVTAAAARFLIEGPSGPTDDFAMAKEIKDALARADAALKAVRAL